MTALTKVGDTGFRMDLEKDEVRNFEAAAPCGNSRKVPDFGLSRDAERPVASFVSVVPPLPRLKNRRCNGMGASCKLREPGIYYGF